MQLEIVNKSKDQGHGKSRGKTTLKSLASMLLVVVGSSLVVLTAVAFIFESITGRHLPPFQTSFSVDSLIIGLVLAGLGVYFLGTIQVPVGETCLLAGAFTVGVAWRASSPEAEIFVAVGLAAFVTGYVLLRKGRGGSVADDSEVEVVDEKVREQVMQRMLEAVETSEDEGDKSDSRQSEKDAIISDKAYERSAGS